MSERPTSAERTYGLTYFRRTHRGGLTYSTPQGRYATAGSARRAARRLARVVGEGIDHIDVWHRPRGLGKRILIDRLTRADLTREPTS